MAYGRREPIICIETQSVFATKHEAAIGLSISESSVHDSLRDCKPHMGFTFVYLADLSEFQPYQLDNRPEGEWRDIVGYEGMYSVSSDGRIWSYPRHVSRRSGRPNLMRGQLLKIFKDASGYCSVSLTDSLHVHKSYLVHRLVAQAFLPNPDNKPEVNHIDGNKSNNNVQNLEWATRIENQHHAIETGLTPAGSAEHMAMMCRKAAEVNRRR